MHPVHRVHARGVDAGKARPRGQKVDPAGERLAQPQPRRGRIGQQRGGQLPRGSVFGDVVGVEPGNRNMFPAGGAQGGDVFGAQQLALAQPALRQLYGMGQHMARRLGHGNRAEPHPWRRTWVICANVATAISAGPAAPMSNPIGPRMRPICCAVNPASSSRATRLAWVRVEPSAPI